MVTRINISLRKEVLKRADKAARDAHTSRSAFIAQAIEHLLEEKERKTCPGEGRERRERMRKAAASIDRFREKYGDWDATAEVLKWRELH